MRLRFLTASALVALAAAGASTGANAMDGVYVQAFGGAALSSLITWGDPTPYQDYVLDPGSAFGASIGMATGMDGVSVELDFLHTSRISEGDSDYFLETNSLMVNGKYTFGVSDMIDLYAGAGVGGINIHYDYSGNPYDGWGLGYQVLAGVEAKVTDTFSIIGEIRHQDAFSLVASDVSPYTHRAPVNAVLIGIKAHM